MSREYKFRAWDKKKKVMRNVTLIRFDCDKIVCEGGVLLCNCYEDNYILMQFTGLKDRNKTPIYEGDILADNPRIKKNIPGHGDLDTAFIAEWDCWEGCECTPGGWGYNFYEYAHKYEVIGNIYENPLEAKDES